MIAAIIILIVIKLLTSIISDIIRIYKFIKKEDY